MIQDRYRTNNFAQDSQIGSSFRSSGSSSVSGLGNSSSFRPYHSSGSFQSPQNVHEAPFSSYSNGSVIHKNTNYGSPYFGTGSSYQNNSPYPKPSSTTTGRIVNTNEYDYLDIGSTGDTIVELLRSMLRLYGKIFISQPWRVGRLISQVGDWSDTIPAKHFTEEDPTHSTATDFDHRYNDYELTEDSEEEENDFHTNTRAQASQYAYRSNSSLSFRNEPYTRRSLVLDEDTFGPVEEDIDDEEMSYFTSIGNDSSSSKPKVEVSRHSKKQSIHRKHSVFTDGDLPKAAHKRALRQDAAKDRIKNEAATKEMYAKFEKYTNRIHPATLDTMDIVFAIYEESGLRGMWRALNTSFFLGVFQTTIEAWLSGFYSSLLGVPDPYFLDMAYSPMPGRSLVTSVVAGVTTAVILAPVSILRTRLMTTTLKTGPRSLRTLLKQQDTWVCPSELMFPTVLFAGVTSAVRKSSGFFIQVVMGVDRVAMPTLYSLLTFCNSLIEIAVKLPLETIVRRGHMAYLTEPEDETKPLNEDKHNSQSILPAPRSSSLRSNSVHSAFIPVTPKLRPADLIIRPEPYEGVFGTIWSVISGRVDIQSLYRGWWWCIIGSVGDLSLETVVDTDYGDGGKERF